MVNTTILFFTHKNMTSKHWCVHPLVEHIN